MAPTHYQAYNHGGAPSAHRKDHTRRHEGTTCPTPLHYHAPTATAAVHAHRPHTLRTLRTGNASQHRLRAQANIAPERPALDFKAIRMHCLADSPDLPDSRIDPRPEAFAPHRTKHWPTEASCLPTHIADIYHRVRLTGLPNAAAARIPVPSGLDIPEWEARLTSTREHKQLVDMLRYGFPLGYMGPISADSGRDNHNSVQIHPEAIRDYKEIECGAMYGPYNTPPFSPWFHISPLMTREKSDPTKRRVITDMSFPREKSVNAFIIKNTAMGDTRLHTLPTVDTFTKELRAIRSQAYMFTMDISRAYKNFRTCPLDWPLLGARWHAKYYLDISVPFGARGSSCHVQRVAEAVVYMLRAQGIRATMYLDDLIVVAPDRATCQNQFQTTRELFATLGLPEAEEKTQNPARKVRWLGIDISAQHMTLTIPRDKLQATIRLVNKCMKKVNITRKQLQSLLGKLLHLSKCVQPARIFVGRLLDALRSMRTNTTPMTNEMQADLAWFPQFASGWNGVALIPPTHPHRVIEVDACMGGIGGADDTRAYAMRLPQQHHAHKHSINHLEALNVIIALHTFIRDDDEGGHVRVMCDNQAAVHVLTSGRGQDPCLINAARAAWMLQAVRQVKVSFGHIAGTENKLADALSRAHISNAHQNIATEMCIQRHLKPINPCLLAYRQHDYDCAHRSTQDETQAGSHTATGTSPGPGHMGQLQGGHQQVQEVLHHIQHPTALPNIHGRTMLDRRAVGPTVPIIGGEHYLPPEDVPASQPRPTRPAGGHQSKVGHGRTQAVESAQAEVNEPRTSEHHKGSRPRTKPYKQGASSRLRRASNVLHGRQTVRGSTEISYGL